MCDQITSVVLAFIKLRQTSHIHEEKNIQRTTLPLRLSGVYRSHSGIMHDQCCQNKCSKIPTKDVKNPNIWRVRNHIFCTFSPQVHLYYSTSKTKLISVAISIYSLYFLSLIHFERLIKLTLLYNNITNNLSI